MHAELAAVPSSLYQFTRANRVIASVRRQRKVSRADNFQSAIPSRVNHVDVSQVPEDERNTDRSLCRMWFQHSRGYRQVLSISLLGPQSDTDHIVSSARHLPCFLLLPIQPRFVQDNALVWSNAKTVHFPRSGVPVRPLGFSAACQMRVFHSRL